MPTDPLQTYIDKALTELCEKSLNDIQVETALTWCGRACAAAQLHDENATEYAHEAIEHAALSGHDSLLQDIRKALTANGVVLSR